MVTPQNARSSWGPGLQVGRLSDKLQLMEAAEAEVLEATRIDPGGVGGGLEQDSKTESLWKSARRSTPRDHEV